MDLLLDLFEFMVIRAQKTGFQSADQSERFHYLCGKMLALHPQAIAYMPAPAQAPQQPPNPWQPAPPPAPAPQQQFAHGATGWPQQPANPWPAPPAPAPQQFPQFTPQTPAPVGWSGL